MMKQQDRGWPSPQDYNEAIQNPSTAFFDEVLRSGLPELTALGVPKPISGAFASVYRMDCGRSSWAVRCFLKRIGDQSIRYQHISESLKDNSVAQRYTVPFEYLEKGIRINGAWFPILKMEWSAGVPLDRFVVEHLGQPDALAKLADGFLVMCQQLQQEGIAHGDLQHGNILVHNGGLKLVDYDGMFVPSMDGMSSNEFGHPNYQHPSRGIRDSGSCVDNFSAWVIYAGLRSLSIDPSLAEAQNALDECMLFRKTDFLSPLTSATFYSWEKHSASSISNLSRCIRYNVSLSPRKVPPLSPEPPRELDLPEVVGGAVRSTAKESQIVLLASPSAESLATLSVSRSDNHSDLPAQAKSPAAFAHITNAEATTYLLRTNYKNLIFLRDHWARILVSLWLFQGLLLLFAPAALLWTGLCPGLLLLVIMAFFPVLMTGYIARKHARDLSSPILKNQSHLAEIRITEHDPQRTPPPEDVTGFAREGTSVVATYKPSVEKVVEQTTLFVTVLSCDDQEIKAKIGGQSFSLPDSVKQRFLETYKPWFEKKIPARLFFHSKLDRPLAVIIGNNFEWLI